jgi:hypothetical protein
MENPVVVANTKCEAGMSNEICTDPARLEHFLKVAAENSASLEEWLTSRVRG